MTGQTFLMVGAALVFVWTQFNSLRRLLNREKQPEE